MIRVLMIVPRFESTARGAEVFTRYLACGLNKKLFTVTIISGPHNSIFPGVNCKQFYLVKREWIIYLFEWFLKLIPRRLLITSFDLEALSLMWSARRFLKEQSFDVILPFGGTWTYRFASWYKKGAKIISVGHAGPVKADLLLSDHFVAITPADLEKSKEITVDLGCSVIPNGVDTTLFSVPAVMRNDQKEKVILCVGELSEIKGQIYLLNALSLLDSNIKCLLVGKGPQKEMIENHPVYRAGRVQIREVPYHEMPEIYHQVDIFTLPCIKEAFGLAYVEALSSGLNVVAPDGPRQRYVVGEAGIFCDVTDPEAYATSLKFALAKPRDDLGVKHAGKFAWQDIITQYETLLIDIGGDTSRATKKE